MDTMEPQQPHRLAMDDALPIILPVECEALLKKLDCSKAPSEDNVLGGVLQNGREAIVNFLTSLFNKSLQLCQVPKAWQNASDGFVAEEGQHIRHKELQASQFAPHHLQCFHTSYCNGCFEL